jgi:hypothetical protein
MVDSERALSGHTIAEQLLITATDRRLPHGKPIQGRVLIASVDVTNGTMPADAARGC